MDYPKAPPEVAAELDRIYGASPSAGGKINPSDKLPDELNDAGFVRCEKYNSIQWCQAPDGTWYQCG